MQKEVLWYKIRSLFQLLVSFSVWRLFFTRKGGWRSRMGNWLTSSQAVVPAASQTGKRLIRGRELQVKQSQWEWISDMLSSVWSRQSTMIHSVKSVTRLTWHSLFGREAKNQMNNFESARLISAGQKSLWNISLWINDFPDCGSVGSLHTNECVNKQVLSFNRKFLIVGVRLVQRSRRFSSWWWRQLPDCPLQQTRVAAAEIHNDASQTVHAKTSFSHVLSQKHVTDHFGWFAFNWRRTAERQKETCHQHVETGDIFSEWQLVLCSKTSGLHCQVHLSVRDLEASSCRYVQVLKWDLRRLLHYLLTT